MDESVYDPANITGFGLTTLINITKQAPNLGLIVIVSVIIGILVTSFIIRQRNKE